MKKTETVKSKQFFTRPEFKAAMGKIDRRFEQVDKRFEQIDRRFEQVDKRFEQIDRRFERVDEQFRQVDIRFNILMDRMEQRFDAMESRFAKMEETMQFVLTHLDGSVAKAERNEQEIHMLSVQHDRLGDRVDILEKRL